ncbi:RNA methyltransferase [Parachlamydia sp. AcF125]|uniref:TrmH family RNA methyltransferase n=1 Tax=Parachlamydia sp. AcF125 TaxID=2795736 RepID=UPI001BD7FD41|nr:RNA methyltransferase [Parachlamydia sp. AcF125]MBS4167738.1 23S rRNA (adenosine(1067)-2'-O)-methyltransferase [Parachlamydia sp. AcF125]
MMTNIRRLSSLHNPLVKHLVKVRQNSDYRQEHQSVVVEGNIVIAEVAQTHLVKRLLTADLSLIPSSICAEEIFLVDQSILDKVSGMHRSPGILAEIKMPSPSPLKNIRSLLVLNQINDPGNLGTLIRSALAFGWEGIFIVNQSCDIFNEKAIRSARGATFRLPYRKGDLQALEEVLIQNRLSPWVADVSGTPMHEVSPPKKVALVLSNEARGASSLDSPLFSQNITIPMSGKMESLNVAIAGAILLYYLKK